MGTVLSSRSRQSLHCVVIVEPSPQHASHHKLQAPPAPPTNASPRDGRRRPSPKHQRDQRDQRDPRDKGLLPDVVSPPGWEDATASTAKLPSADGRSLATDFDELSFAPSEVSVSSSIASLPPAAAIANAIVSSRQRSTTPVDKCLSVHRKPVFADSPNKRGKSRLRRHPPEKMRPTAGGSAAVAKALGIDVDDASPFPLDAAWRAKTPHLAPCFPSGEEDIDACLKALRSSSVVSVAGPPGPKFAKALLKSPPPGPPAGTFGSFARPPPPAAPKRHTSLEAMTDETLNTSHLYV